jgi:hypothetical protein
MQRSEEGDRGITGDTGDERRRRRSRRRRRRRERGRTRERGRARKWNENGPQISRITQIRKEIESRLAPMPKRTICGICG